MTYAEFLSKQFSEKSVFERRQFDWFTNLVKWLALRFSYLLYSLGVSANTLDVISLFLVLIGFFFLTTAKDGKIALPLVGILLIFFHVFVDFADGPIAKARGEKTIIGWLLDNLGCDLDRMLLWTLLGIYTSNPLIILANVFAGCIFLFLTPQSRKAMPETGPINFLGKIFIHKYSFLSVRFNLGLLPLLLGVCILNKIDLVPLAWGLSLFYIAAGGVWLLACIPNFERKKEM